MKLFYHFLVLVATSLILIACANMFASTPEKKLKPAQRSDININEDSLYNSEINTRLIFSDSHYNDVLNRYNNSNHRAKNLPFNKLLIAANYVGLNQIEE
ncbi:hypothetical protein [Mucilaginibacter sp.]|uniref:hypothetical protein n=1 Tax=Mucilaginibacter sp. TaxID=1882438 RepID=UPI002ED38179